MVLISSLFDLFYGMAAGDKEQRKIKQKAELEKLAARITQFRKDRGYSSFEKFAYDHNISRAQWGRYEKGQNLRFSSLVTVAEALQIPLDTLLKDFESSDK